MNGTDPGWSPDLQATFCATLMDQWASLGLRAVMVSPGSRSTPLALAAARQADLAVQVFHDERSAGFAALGWAKASAAPAAVLCTSGTAATHFHAAVVEASLSGVPLLVVTADRPPEVRGMGAPQTIDQRHLYGESVRWYADLAPVGPPDRVWWRVAAAEAWQRATGRRPGPVHLNIGLREPLLGTAGALPAPIDWTPATAGDGAELAAERHRALAGLDVQRGVIVAGQGVDDVAAVGRLTEALNWPVLADPQSGCRVLDGVICAFDSLLRHPRFSADHSPHAVLQLGMPPASKVLSSWLAAAPHCRHVSVSPAGLVSDPHLLGAAQVHASVGTVADELVAVATGASGTPWRARWQHAERLAQRAIADQLSEEWSEPAVARLLSELPPEVHLVVSSSMPVRDLEWFGAPGDGPMVHANRGANGIDGVLATATGVALTGAPTVALLGDVAMCHDASSLTALAGRPVDLTIVVVDNDGGGIFSFLPQAAALDDAGFERLFGTPHGTDLVALASAHGIDAVTVTARAELARQLRQAGSGHGVRLLRVPSNRRDNVAVHRRVTDAVAAALGPA